GRERLLERALDEGRTEPRAQPLHDGDDGDRDAGGDEAVLDGGRGRLVLHEALHEIDHFCLHGSQLTLWAPGGPLLSGRSGTGTNASRPHLAARVISVTKIPVIRAKYSVVNDTFFQLFVG